MPLPTQVLLTSPTYFRVAYVINPHMAGNIGTVNKEVAHEQWDILWQSYSNLGFTIHTLPGRPGLPDMVFCANQTLPFFRTDGTRGIILSQMYAPERRGEVEFFEAYFRGRGYKTVPLPSDHAGFFEGMGDAIWHPRFRLLWGGYGYRTNPSAYEWVTEISRAPVLMLELQDPDFYHLDTCFCPLNEHTVLIYGGAFTREGRALIQHIFDHVLEAPEAEARHLFACNAHCPDGHHVIIQKGCTKTNQILRTSGFEPIEVDTSEFLKAGGSVFCMKLMHW
jgi:N-dimethylarginine dimethylaminohydrolase